MDLRDDQSRVSLQSRIVLTKRNTIQRCRKNTFGLNRDNCLHSFIPFA